MQAPGNRDDKDPKGDKAWLDELRLQSKVETRAETTLNHRLKNRAVDCHRAPAALSLPAHLAPPALSRAGVGGAF